MSRWRGWVPGVAAIVAIVALDEWGTQWWTGALPAEPDSPRSVPVPPRAEFVLPRAPRVEAPVLPPSDPSPVSWLSQESSPEVLLDVALAAVEDEDNEVLGATLVRLGHLATRAQDYGGARLYFEEALVAYERIDDSVGQASVHLEMARMHIKLRQRAQIAGQAYDRTLLARSQASAERFEAAAANLELAVRENLSVHRFGAAAEVLRTLTEVHHATGDLGAARAAGAEAAELFAASGQPDQASRLIEHLQWLGAPPDELERVRDTVREIGAEHRQSLEKMAVAADYRALMHHYQSIGDLQRAWEFRLRMDKVLTQVARVAMYRRTPDVIAVLYQSLGDMDDARGYLEQAEAVFAANGAKGLLARAHALAEHLE